jgi:hypothetical protein
MLSIQWFQDLPKHDQEKFKETVLNSKIVLDKVAKVCYNKIIELDNVTTSDYDSPSWACKQAHLNGKREALKEILQLVDISPDRGFTKRT